MTKVLLMIRKTTTRSRTISFFFAAAAACLSQACYSPVNSQEYFVEATADDRSLEPVYSTSLYTVYFDYVLSRCVIHSAHTWGQNGGGGGGTGIGITAFRCDPSLLRERARQLGLKVHRPRRKMRRVQSRKPRPVPSREPSARPAPTETAPTQPSSPAPLPQTSGGAQ